jgi:hypothetical protein
VYDDQHARQGGALVLALRGSDRLLLGCHRLELAGEEAGDATGEG